MRRVPSQDSKGSFILACVFALTPLTSTVSAEQLLLTSGATVQGVVDRRDNITTNSEPGLTRTATFEFFYPYPARPGSFQEGSFEAFGEARYGRLDLGLSTRYAGNATGGLTTVFSSGLWQDGLTFLAPSAGRVQLEYRLLGHSTSTSDNLVQSQAIVRFYGGLAGPPVFTDYFPTNGNLAATYQSAPIPFTSGVAVQVVGSMGSNLRLLCADPANAGTCAVWEGSGVIAVTAVLSGIHLYDEAGVPIEDFSVISQSGRDYTEAGVLPVSTLLSELADEVIALNLGGVSSSLDAKLKTVAAALSDTNSHNDIAAVKALHAFINTVEAQRAKRLSDEESDLLVSAAEQIIRILNRRS